MENRTIAKLLFSIWKVLFGIFGITSCFYLTYSQVNLGITIGEMPSMFYYVFALLCALFFIPFLALIYRIAHKEGCEKISIRVKKLLWILGICASGTLLANILAIIVPDYF